jgi:membrane protease YdiL (CAAX protease family)
MDIEIEVILETLNISFIITWVLNHTKGSILLAILLHSIVDAFASKS